MTSVVLFALQERSTGRLMSQNKCATRAEFGDNGPPRVFTTAQAATQALNCWRMGWWRLTGDEDGVWPEPSLWDANKEIAKRRQATDIDVVEMLFALRSPGFDL